MQELSLNILDIAMNSVRAGADRISILLEETDTTLSISVSDNGCGMTEEFVAEVTDPFRTTRTTRDVGMGIPLFQMAAEMTGGSLSITSKDKEHYPKDHGTCTSALFHTDNIDCMPLGDIIETVVTLIQGNPALTWHFEHKKANGKQIILDTGEIKQILEDVPLDNPEVLLWIRGYLEEGYAE